MSARGRLPEGWRLVPLGDVCESATGQRNPGKEPEKTFIYVDISSVDNDQKRIVEPKRLLGIDAPSRARKVIRQGDVIISTTRPNLNAVALVPGELDNQICSTGFCVLRPVSSLIDSAFLFGFVRTEAFVSSLSDLVKGALYPAVTDRQVLTQLIPLPPLPEQRRIVAALEERLATVERARQAARAQLDAARALPAAYLRAVFEGEEARGWPLKPLGDLSEIGTGTTPATNVSAYYQGHIPFIKTAQIVNNRIDRADTHISEPAMQQYGLKLYPIGTILMGMYGQGKTRGQVAILDIPATTTQNAAAIVPRDELISEYLWYWLRRQYLHLRHLGFHGELAHLSLEYVKKLEIPTPGLGVQQRVVQQLTETFSEAGKLIEEIERQLKHIEVLSSSYLQQAFRGEL